MNTWRCKASPESWLFCLEATDSRPPQSRNAEASCLPEVFGFAFGSAFPVQAFLAFHSRTAAAGAVLNMPLESSDTWAWSA
eukprot:CAMPEP_0197667442 /NCGR_PEP_ID=MMETSP1338-20131121/66413_1 /TAXON_ID=43686 ORGANISM="Pelagodinium beii, Strain RCC1491" /NCGR_SAMPLE_ID=MMETSP1338 /ASSEMBLY_ACC=CAM_ASM_000754 /LENGTH=80 /DNA_ID=CAMNT_0043246679 /DNA_START=117 /DNA_END=359 /DNA_ORIENTATION=-